MNQKTNRLTFRPLRIIVGYIILTILLNFFGSVTYKDYSYGAMLVFMFFAILAIILGYFSSFSPYSKSQKSLHNKVDSYFLKESTIDLIIVISMVIVFLFEFFVFLSYTYSISGFNFEVLLERIKNVGDIYKSSLDAATDTTEVNRLIQFITIFGLFKLIAIVGYLLRKDKLIKYRHLFWGIIIMFFINVLAFKGTQKEIGDLFIYFSSVGLIRNAISKRIKLYKFVIPMFVICIAVFGFMQLSRANTFNIGLENFETEFFVFDGNHIVYKLFGEKIGFAITSLIYYVSGGYYGLSKSLTVGFQWTYGLGNSFALSSYATQYLGIDDMIAYTVPVRAEEITGYPGLMYWSTIFPWIASDLTFPGCIVFIFVFARLYAISWRETIYNKNLLSALLFSKLNIMWVFLPANNQLMQSRESAISTIALIILWLFYHKKFSKKSFLFVKKNRIVKIKNFSLLQVGQYNFSLPASR